MIPLFAPLQPGDQIRLSPPGPLLTVTALTPHSLSVETWDTQVEPLTLGGASLGAILERYGVTPVHPWPTLAARFPALLRLTPHPPSGAGWMLEVDAEPRRAVPVFVAVGLVTPDGQAALHPRWEGTVEVALRVAALSAGWQCALLGWPQTPDMLGVTLRRQGTGREVVLRGMAETGALALARALMLQCEEVLPLPSEEMEA